uniref:Uncharacterized protein n=1 Tax=Anguilla anguilla TaxID=7936 RepID=A0A0E9PNK8_ANGAN
MPLALLNVKMYTEGMSSFT